MSGIAFVIIYFDDILIATPSLSSHVQAVREVLKRLNEHNMRVRLEKCKFLQESVKYLGVIVDKTGQRPDPGKCEAITSMPPPQCAPQLRSYLGALTFYSKFIRDMASIRSPLNNLLKKGIEFAWNEECQQAFLKFKQILLSDLLLTHYDPSLPIVVAADASRTGLGGIGYHEYQNGSMKAFIHVSRSLTDAESRYSQTELEGLAIVWTLERLHKYVFGRKFVLYTDHQPLLAIFGSKKGVPQHVANRIQRWAISLMSYHFELRFTRTEDFGHADVLSRLIESQRRTEVGDLVIAEVKFDETHPGITGMKALARSFVYWPGIDEDVSRVVQGCSQCQSAAKFAPKTLLSSWPTPSGPWDRVHCDFAGPINGHTFFLLVDAYTKWPEVIRMPTTTTEATIAAIQTVCSRFGVMQTLVSDNGPQFTSDLFAAFCKGEDIRHVRTAPYHPQSNGQCERFVDTFKRSMKKAGSLRDSDINLFLRGYRATPHASGIDGKSPAELMFGRPIRLPLSAVLPPKPQATEKNKEMESQFNLKHGARNRTFNSGDLVRVRLSEKHLWEEAKVIERRGRVMYNVLTHDGRLLRAHANQLQRMTVIDDALLEVPVPQAAPPATRVRVNPRAVTRSSPPVLRPRQSRQ